jgi:large subunit ribosomal protein L22
MESRAYIKNIKISPKKLRFLLPTIKKMTPAGSLDYLYYTPKKGAKFFYQAIKSAIDNGKQTMKINEDLLKFKLLTVEEGRKLKRYQPGGKGAAKPIRKEYSHIKVILMSDVKQPVIKNTKSVIEEKVTVEKSKIKKQKSKIKSEVKNKKTKKIK